MPVAYVQLKPGSSATEDELLTFVRGHINERAAVPKSIRIVATVPLTGVGKIFKPALKLKETEEALAEALRGAGIAAASVAARHDPTHGMVIDVDLAEPDLAQRAEEALGQFAFQCRIAHQPG